jgi:DNA-binding XRE family transcriptional regulator
MSSTFYPRSQKELLRLARGEATQKEFANRLDVDKSCLSRYEAEKLGAPVRVINDCLQIIAERLTQTPGPQFAEALQHAKLTVKLLEQ